MLQAMRWHRSTIKGLDIDTTDTNTNVRTLFARMLSSPFPRNVWRNDHRQQHQRDKSNLAEIDGCAYINDCTLHSYERVERYEQTNTGCHRLRPFVNNDTRQYSAFEGRANYEKKTTQTGDNNVDWTFPRSKTHFHHIQIRVHFVVEKPKWNYKTKWNKKCQVAMRFKEIK